MIPFKLEDFFDRYEHCPGLINLASSDASPWSAAYLRDQGIAVAEASFSLGYPDVNGRLLPNLKQFCAPPAGVGLLPTSGAAEAIALVMHEHSQTQRGKCIAIPSPAYGAFSGLAELLGIPARTYSYEPGHGWAPDPSKILDLAKQCAALVVTNPHNPTGHVMPREFLEQVAGELAAHDGILIVDEVFRVPDETPTAMGLSANVVVFGSLSKTYGLPGLRLGWVAATEERLKRFRTVQQYLTLTLSAMTVELGAAILERPGKFSRADLIRENRKILADWAKSHPGVVSISEPNGGTTVALAFKTATAEQELFDKFLEKGVLMAPGSQCFESYEGVKWFRLGYGTQTDKLREGLERISAVV
jgi:aspartate/methionine/tyrosine aminotransferase